MLLVCSDRIVLDGVLNQDFKYRFGTRDMG
nr:MAG TPA: hypothetical protein [Caudoviricetes sp.]